MMSVTAAVTNYIKFSGDLEQELIFASGDLLNSPAVQELKSLSTGNNAITVPDVEDFVTHGLAIVPPELNTTELTLKGINGDTGIALSANRVSVFQFGAAPPVNIVLSVSDDIDGVRLIWF